MDLTRKQKSNDSKIYFCIDFGEKNDRARRKISKEAIIWKAISANELKIKFIIAN